MTVLGYLTSTEKETEDLRNFLYLIATTGILLTCLSQSAVSKERYVYGVLFKGFACYKESKHFIGAKNDEPFVLTYVQDQSGKISGKTLPGGKFEYFKGMNRGDVVPYELLVWQGNAQTLKLHADLWEFNRVKRKTVKGIFHASAIAALLGAAISGQDAGVVIAEISADMSRKMKGRLHDFMGTHSTTINLRQVGKMADRPQQRMKNVRYDFSTDHRGDGAHYKLFWEVRRHRLR